ncbi:flagellar biosynthesis regulator FlaF [Cochlodiniinecator piscidefendens]|uniref:flagellar biosynthesis regulator FlaF n=1 Tax=Cochlodiniinecator piscidefendens TaxID=2715756 RepID=UPI002F3ECB3D
MNAFNMAKTAYTASTQAIRTPRRTEFEAFAKITQKLKAAADAPASDFTKRAEAIYDNRQLWTLIASQVADDDNELPRQLRARLFYLAEFTNEHSRKVLKNEAGFDALIEINTAIMRGLRDDPTIG